MTNAPAIDSGGTGSRIFVIAEAGVNHNGDPDLAHSLVEVAKRAGADAVKFPTFSADRVVAKNALKAAYQLETTDKSESQYEMLKRLELSEAMHLALAQHARELGLEFMSTPFDEAAASFLAERLGVVRLKIPSGEITNGPFLLHIARLGLPMVLSTGASTISEVGEALGVIGFGLMEPRDAVPKRARLDEYRLEAQALLEERVTLLHCTTEYPAPVHDANLNAITTLRETFSLNSGLSDHSAGIALAIASVALGAQVIEKHFTLDRSLSGPDHRASLEPDELAQMIDGIRMVSVALGDGVKRPAPSEMANLEIVRRSLVAKSDIAAGSLFDWDNLEARRPGSGVSPMTAWQMIGHRASRSYRRGDLIDD